MPITSEEARTRALSGQAGPQRVQLPADVHDFNSVISGVFGSVTSSMTQAAVQAGDALRPLVKSFDAGLPAAPKQTTAAVRKAPCLTDQTASGPLSAAGSPGASLVPGHRARRPPALTEDTRGENRTTHAQNPRVLQVQREIKSVRRMASPKASRNRRSSIYTVVEESVLEEAPVIAVLDLPDLQADRVRESLCFPPPLQPFVVEGLQSDSRRFMPSHLNFCNFSPCRCRVAQSLGSIITNLLCFGSAGAPSFAAGLALLDLVSRTWTSPSPMAWLTRRHRLSLARSAWQTRMWKEARSSGRTSLCYLPACRWHVTRAFAIVCHQFSRR